MVQRHVTGDFGGEDDKLYGGGTDARDMGELHASRAEGRYAKQASQSTQGSQRDTSTQVAPLSTDRLEIDG